MKDAFPGGNEKNMKTGHISGFLAIFILGLLLTAGCSGTGSPGNTLSPAAPATTTIAPAAAPVLTPALQVVYETAFVPPAKTTIAPASAPMLTPALQAVHETEFVPPATTTIAPTAAPVLTPALQVVHETAYVPPTTIPTVAWATTPYQYHESAYTSYNLRPAVSADGVAGTLVTRVTGCSSDNLIVFIARAGTNVSPIDNQYLLDRMVAGDQNTGFLPVKILPDGSSEMVSLAPGTYTAYLPNKSGDEIEEQQSFKIGANVITYLSFIGSSYSTPGSPGSSCRRR
jgi:hypothetical protein